VVFVLPSDGNALCTIDGDGTGACWGGYFGSGCQNLHHKCTCESGGTFLLGGRATALSDSGCTLTTTGAIECPGLWVKDAPVGGFTVLGRSSIGYEVAVSTDGGIAYWNKWRYEPPAWETPVGRHFVDVEVTETFDAMTSELHLATCGVDDSGDLLCWGPGVETLRPCFEVE